MNQGSLILNIKKINFILNYLYVGVCTSASTRGAQKVAWDLLELEFQTVVSYSIWVLETKFRSFTGGVSTLSRVPTPVSTFKIT